MSRGFTALKTNMVIPGDPATVYFPGFGSGINTTDGAPSVEILDAIERLIERMTLIAAERPGRNTAVFRLPRAKSCPTTPLLTTLKRTRPTGTIRRDKE